MSVIMILFAFALSLIINFVEKILHPTDEQPDTTMKERTENFAVEESE
jgi:hypothetical protein